MLRRAVAQCGAGNWVKIASLVPGRTQAQVYNIIVPLNVCVRVCVWVGGVCVCVHVCMGRWCVCVCACVYG